MEPTTRRMERSHFGYLPPIVSSFIRPKTTQERIPVYCYTRDTAPMDRDSVITFETMGDDLLLLKDPLESQGIVSLQSYIKKGQGLMFHNRTSVKLHYETSMKTLCEVIIPRAHRRSIPHQLFCPNSGTPEKVVSGDNVFIILSGGTFNNFHEKVCFRQIIRDACIPAVATIVAPDSGRGNSGPTVGLASSQVLSKQLGRLMLHLGLLLAPTDMHRFLELFLIQPEIFFDLKECSECFSPPLGNRRQGNKSFIRTSAWTFVKETFIWRCHSKFIFTIQTTFRIMKVTSALIVIFTTRNTDRQTTSCSQLGILGLSHS